MTGPTSSFETKVGIYTSLLGSAIALLSGAGLSLKASGQVMALVQFASLLARRASAGVAQLRVVNDQITVLVNEHRGPTPAEWETWESQLATNQVVWDELEQK